MKSILVDMHATKELQARGGGEWLQKHKEDAGSQPNYLELRLGVSSRDGCAGTDVVAASSSRPELSLARSSAGPKLMFLTNLEDGFNSTAPPPPSAAGTKRYWLPEAAATAAACGGFVHPWSLAARQQKAAFEQAHHISCSNPSSSTASRFVAPPTPPTVGWPPVRAFRRNIVGSQTTRPEMNGEKEAKKPKVSREEEDTARVAAEARATLFVKVNMEGFAVGRKINLKAHHSYDSLSRTLQKMFNNFLSANYCNNSTEEEQDDSPTTDYILLYEDHEGDRMLVGDVPWEMFITTVKRLHIAHNPKARKNENKKDQRDDDDDDRTEQ
ncbi:auxin-responsive protein IAA25-like isoform X1 [Iris pallida]|uniref:Auxin-responsive protein n=1 Tax=Iris pallida TaxID=29817 RepID=A0AAX6EP89_IRIPA|nr:auxin-responsive protein IAA25-like isoform X1 [Iris pallida]